MRLGSGESWSWKIALTANHRLACSCQPVRVTAIGRLVSAERLQKAVGVVLCKYSILKPRVATLSGCQVWVTFAK